MLMSDVVSHKTFIKVFGGSLTPELLEGLFLQCYHIANIHLPLKSELFVWSLHFSQDFQKVGSQNGQDTKKIPIAW